MYMSEIGGHNFSVNQINFNSSQKPIPEQPQDIQVNEEPKLKDFSDPKAEVLGRSMLVKDIDNINNDLKALMQNPQLAENSDKLFETSYQSALDAGIDNPYEEAATFSTGKVE